LRDSSALSEVKQNYDALIETGNPLPVNDARLKKAGL
jgi:hypothetical protein